MKIHADDLGDPGLSAARVVLVVESPLSDRDAERFGVRTLKDAGLRVEVWEVSPLTLPSSELQSPSRPSNVVVRRFADSSELLEGCLSLSRGDLVIFIMGIYAGDVARCRLVLQAISASEARLGGILGRSPWERFQLTHAYSRDWPTPLFVYLRARIWLASAVLGVWRWGAGLPGIRALRRRKNRVRPLDFAWVATSTRSLDPLLIGPHTTVRRIHTLDFDSVRSLQNHPDVAAGRILYIDGLGPMHPDVVSLEMDVEIRPTSDYFGQLCRAFDWVEALSGNRVVVAAHPRAQPGELERLYGSRSVVYGSTVAALDACKFVLMSHPSDAVSLVVALRKPVLVISSSSNLRYERRGISELAKKLSLTSIDTENLPREFVEPSIDMSAYDRFFRKHVKIPNSITGSFWEVVADDAQGRRR